MSSTKTAKYLLRGYVALLFLLYASFVIIDMGAGYLLSRIDGSYARSLERERKCAQDYMMIDNARDQGYSSLLYPELYNKTPYKEIALKNKIAPLGAQPNSNLYYCNEGYSQVRYKSDRYGFRNENYLWDAQADLVIIGDSFVHGACVSSDQTLSGILNKNGYKTLNLGTGSNSPIHYAAISKTFLDAVKPKVAVTVFYSNDNIDGEENSIYYEIFFARNTSYFKTTTGKDRQLSSSLKSLIDESSITLEKTSRQLNDERSLEKTACQNSASFVQNVQQIYSYLTQHLRLKSTIDLINVFLRTAPEHKKELPFGSKLAVDTLKTQCEKNKCIPLVVYISNSKFWRPDSRASNYEFLLKEYSQQNKVDFLSMTNELNNTGIDAYAIKGPHLSPLGYRLVAKKIEDFFRSMQD